MTAQDGRIVSDKDLAGHPYLVFFGYTHCPDLCPTTLTEISAAFKAMGDDKKIAALFVTVDPERDTPDMMKTYLESFDPRIIGLSADARKTRAMAKAFKVYFKKRATENDELHDGPHWRRLSHGQERSFRERVQLSSAG